MGAWQLVWESRDGRPHQVTHPTIRIIDSNHVSIREMRGAQQVSAGVWQGGTVAIMHGTYDVKGNQYRERIDSGGATDANVRELDAECAVERNLLTLRFYSRTDSQAVIQRWKRLESPQ